MSKVQTKSGKVSGLPSGRKASGGLGKVSVSGGKASGVQSGRKASGVKAPVPGGKASGLQSGGKVSGLQSGKVSAGRGRAAGDGTANHYLPRGVLTVNVIDATDLKGRTTLPGAYDPYVKITVGEQTASTREAKNAGSKPSWNQAFDFPLKLERNVISPIRVQVYDRSDSTEQSLMGEVSVDLADIPERKTPKSWKHTDSKNLCLGSEADRGQIRLSIAFQQKTAAAANMSATPVKDQSGNSRGSGSTSGSISGTVEEEEEEEEGGGFPLALDALEVVALGIGFAAEVYALASSGKDEEDDGETEEGESNKRDPDEEEAEEAEPNQRDADEEEFEPEEAETTQRDADEEEEPQEPEPEEPEEAESNQRDADEEEFEPEEAESNQRDADEAEFEPEEAESTQRDPDEEEEPQEPEPNQVDSNVDKEEPEEAEPNQRDADEEEPEEGEPNSNKSH